MTARWMAGLPPGSPDAGAAIEAPADAICTSADECDELQDCVAADCVPGSPRRCMQRSFMDAPDYELVCGCEEYDGPTLPVFVRGDANVSGRVDISDAIAILNFLFLGSPGPRCRDRMDGDDSGRIDITDGIFVLRYLFGSGDRIPKPFPEPGIDLTSDELECPDS
jgi:hypothetical protein